VSVHAPQSRGDQLHHVKCKVRRQFHQPEEPLLVDNGETAVARRASGRAAGQRVDERHFTEHGDRQNALDHGACQFNVESRSLPRNLRADPWFVFGTALLRAESGHALPRRRAGYTDYPTLADQSRAASSGN